jgi:hypothetical protein
MFAGPALLGNPKAVKTRGIDFKQVMYAGVGGGTGALIGGLIGSVLVGGRRYDD